MAGRRRPWGAITMGVVAVAVAVGAGAYVFGSARAAAAQQPLPGAAAGATGASTSPDPAPSGSGKATPSPAGTAEAAVPPGCLGGDHQRAVETALARLDGYSSVAVDGVQTAPDCELIKKFQTRYGISPAAGRAGPTTADVARRLAASADADEQGRCRVRGTGTTICVDLTQQTAWAIRDGALVWGPTVVRTGMGGGYQTPTGTYEIYSRAEREWSVPYKVWLPYWQAFNGGIGFHETTTYLHDGSLGSHGCVNLLHADAVALWNAAGVGATVKVFGNRPGT
ncbi:L,D-transpeptidase [Planosporangium thailandense]|nr:L,D-transpeptidase [Planosporangium thailandense]